jgi:hypothetical protein
MQHGTKRSCSFDFNNSELFHKRIRTASTQVHHPPTHGCGNDVLNATIFEQQRTFTSPRGFVNSKEREFVPHVTAAGADTARSAPTSQILDLHARPDDDASTPRIVDLSTGDVLERVPSPNERVSRQKGKRMLDENDDNVNIMQTLMVSKTDWCRAADDGDLLVDFSPPNKKFRTNEAVADQSYLIEEIDEEEGESDIVGLVNDTATNSQRPDALSLVVRNNPNGKVKLALPYHQAFASYMRSQFGNLKDETWTNKDMQLVPYRSQLVENASPVEADEDDVGDTGCQIYEITELDEGEVDMTDTGVVNSERIDVVNFTLEDQMDVD